MIEKFKFNRNRVVFGIVFNLLMLIFSIWFVKNPDIFIRNQWMKAEHIKAFGAISTIYFILSLYSFILIYPKDIGIIIGKDYFIDHTRYKALGRVKWSEIDSIQKIKKSSLEIIFKESMFKNRNVNFFSRALFFIHNGNINQSIVISSALLNCSIEELYKSINLVFEKHNLHLPR